MQNGVFFLIFFFINIGFKPNSDKIMHVQMNQNNDASIFEVRRGKHKPEHKPIIKLFVSRS